MERLELISPCHFGLEAVLKREVQNLGYRVIRVEDGRVHFEGDAGAVAAANIFLRSAERILIKAGEFKAMSFDELFEETKAIPWEYWFPKDAKTWAAKVSSVKSTLYSPSDIQRIIKKAIADRLGSCYKTEWLPETGASYPLRVSINKDIVTIGIDTTGISLHKRGYRVSPVIAPISETLAASLILLTPWKKDRILVDPFCGSGTFLIEAAMMAANMAPGAGRNFLSETWESIVPKNVWIETREKAKSAVHIVKDVDLQGYDIDEEAVRFSRDNARAAGVEEMIHFQRREVRDLSHPKKYGFIITNPPYGERIEENDNLPIIYRELGEAYKKLDSWSMYLITAYEDAERCIGRKADKNRKIYNGMIKTYFYEFLGPKPPRRP